MITPPAENMINIARRMRETASERGISDEILQDTQKFISIREADKNEQPLFFNNP